MRTNMDDLYRVYYAAVQKAARQENYRQSNLLEDVGAWLSGWDVYLGNPEREDLPDGPRPTLKELKKRIAG